MRIHYTFRFPLLFVLMSVHMLAQSDDGINYLDYFASDNSLDNQPLIGTENHLRFFPVFALKDSTYSVQMRIYRNHDPVPYCRNMDRMKDGIYWEALLPSFRLGQGIHRIEVEVQMSLDSDLHERYVSLENLRKIAEHLRKQSDSVLIAQTQVARNGKDQLSVMVQRMQRLDKLGDLDTLTRTALSNASDLIKVIASLEKLMNENSTLVTNDTTVALLPRLEGQVQHAILLSQTLQNDFDNLRTVSQGTSDGIENIHVVVDEIAKQFNQINTLLSAINDSTLKLNEDLRSREVATEKIKRETEEQLYESVFSQIGSHEYSGPGVKKFDVVVDDSLKNAKILYRNYNLGMRRNPALDPAEQLGIFRARYVPFAVIGGEMVSPTSTGANRMAVFEVGLGFGNLTIASDQLWKPALSPDRLGVIFAISQDLLSDSSTIRALALTYEFNAYGSISVGANFPINKEGPARKEVESYFSFGINKKAFEALMELIQNVVDP